MFSTLVLVFLLAPSCFASQTGLSLAKECFNKWMNSKPTGKYDEIHCYRLKLLINCLIQSTTETIRMLDDFRFMVEQEAIFAKMYNICPKMDPTEFKKIKELVETTGIARIYRYDQIDGGQWSECAKEVHTICINEYIDVFEKHRMCRDFSVFVSCLHAEKNKINCQSSLINHMIKLYDEAGNDFLKQMKTHLGRKCSN